MPGSWGTSVRLRLLEVHSGDTAPGLPVPASASAVASSTIRPSVSGPHRQASVLVCVRIPLNVRTPGAKVSCKKPHSLDGAEPTRASLKPELVGRGS